MENSWKTGFMAVFAVSGSVVFISMQVHKRLLSNFMKKMEFEIKQYSAGSAMDEPKKKVRFADDAVEPTAHEKIYGKKRYYSYRNMNDENLEAVPQNWQVMYKGILQYRNLRGV